MTQSEARTTCFFVGLVLILALAAGLSVPAAPAQAQVGCGNPDLFDLGKTAEPDPVRVGQRLTFTVTATNNTPCLTVVVVEDELPAGVRFVSVATDDPGVCQYDPSSNTVGCVLFVPGDGSTTVDIVVVPTTPGTITNTASDIFGNQARATVTVVGPTPPPAPPAPPPTPSPPPQPQPASTQQDGEQEAESGDVDQSFEVSG